MDLNLPGNTWMPIDRGQSPERKLAAVRPEKQALEVIRQAGGRVTSPAAVETQDEKLRKTAEEFESIFLFQMLKQVRNAMHKEEFLNGGMAEEMFTGMLDEEYAKVMAKSRSTERLSIPVKISALAYSPTLKPELKHETGGRDRCRHYFEYWDQSPGSDSCSSTGQFRHCVQ